MKTIELTITKELAGEMLEADEKARTNGKEVRHRNVSGYSVANYAADLDADNWKKTHQGMLICETGEVIDGRHRLYAIQKSGKSMKTLVTNGISEEEGREMIKYIDGIRPRSIATQLWLSEGIDGAPAIVAAIRSQWGLALGSSKEHGGSTSMVTAAFNAQSKSINQIIIIMTSYHRKTPSYVTGPVAYYASAHPKSAAEFATSYVTGEKLAATSPVIWLKRTLETRTSKKLRHRVHESGLIVCNALYAFHNTQRCNSPFRVSNIGREWLVEEASKLTKVLVDTAPRYVTKRDRWIPMGEPK